jgi:hypothetical protein
VRESATTCHAGGPSRRGRTVRPGAWANRLHLAPGSRPVGHYPRGRTIKPIEAERSSQYWTLVRALAIPDGAPFVWRPAQVRGRYRCFGWGGGGSIRVPIRWRRSTRNARRRPDLANATVRPRVVVGRVHGGLDLAAQFASVDGFASERTLDSRDRPHQPERSGVGSASAARHRGGSKGSAKYWVSWATRPPENSMMLTEWVGTPS